MPDYEVVGPGDEDGDEVDLSDYDEKADELYYEENVDDSDDSFSEM